MFKILPWSQVNAPDKKDSAHRDDKQCDSKDPPKHARLTFAQTITETANGFDSIAGFAQFLAQPADVSVNGAGIDHTFVTPDIAEQAVALLNTAATLHQRTQQFVLETGEINDFAVDGDVMAQAVDLDRSGSKRLRFVRRLASAQNCLSAQDHFARRER